MKKTFKAPMITFFILSLVFAAGWIALVIVTGITQAKDLGGFLKNAIGGFVNPRYSGGALAIDALIYNVNSKVWFPRGFTTQPYSWTTYLFIAVLVIFVLYLVLGLVYTIKYKRKRYIPYILVIILSLFGVSLFLANAANALYFITHWNNKPLMDILCFAAICCMFLLFVCMVLCFSFGLVHAKRLALAAPKEEAVEAVDEAPVEEQYQEELLLTDNEQQPEGVLEAEDASESFTAIASDDNAVAVDEVEKPDNYEPMNDFMVEPNELNAEPEEIVVEEIKAEDIEKPEAEKPLNASDLAAMIKDVVRDIVRDEIARSVAAKEEEQNRPSHKCEQPSITGATFGGPLVVQYFNGGINSPAPAPVIAPAPAPVAPAPEPVAPAPVQEEKPVEPVAEPVKEEPKPAPVPTPVPATEEKEHKEIIRIPFEKRIISADKEMQMNYNDLKNEILSWGVNSRVSNSGDTFRLHKKTYVKITVAGKSLKLYFALNPNDYKDSPIPVQDASSKAIYAEIPLIFKVKSPLSVKRAKGLIQEVMERDGLEQKEVESINWVKELKANSK